jgi:hypothetical protein
MLEAPAKLPPSLTRIFSKIYRVSFRMTPREKNLCWAEFAEEAVPFTYKEPKDHFKVELDLRNFSVLASVGSLEGGGMSAADDSIFPPTPQGGPVIDATAVVISEYDAMLMDPAGWRMAVGLPPIEEDSYFRPRETFDEI